MAVFACKRAILVNLLLIMHFASFTPVRPCGTKNNHINTVHTLIALWIRCFCLPFFARPVTPRSYRTLLFCLWWIKQVIIQDSKIINNSHNLLDILMCRIAVYFYEAQKYKWGVKTKFVILKRFSVSHKNDDSYHLTTICLA